MMNQAGLNLGACYTSYFQVYADLDLLLRGTAFIALRMLLSHAIAQQVHMRSIHLH